MVDIELKRKVRVSREDAARRLIAFGEALAAGGKVQLEEEGNSISFAIPEEVEWKFELEVDDDETELEIEIKWSEAPPAAESLAPPPTESERLAEVADEG